MEQIDTPGSIGQWVSVDDLARDRYFGKQPWILADGGLEMVEQIASAQARRLGDMKRVIGRYTHTGLDDSYFAPAGTWLRFGLTARNVVPLVFGEAVRDWLISTDTETIFPYGEDLRADLAPAVAPLLWRYRPLLRERREPGGTHEEIGLTWYEWSRWHPERYSVPLGIAFPFVSTHNNFALDRGGKVFKQTAPVIKLREGVNEDGYIQLLGVLNSSTAGFWLKMVSYPRGGVQNPEGVSPINPGHGVMNSPARSSCSFRCLLRIPPPWPPPLTPSRSDSPLPYPRP